jgi:hypothetical protein
MENWSDCKKWWMDVVKSVIGFSLGTAVTALIFLYWTDKYQHKWEISYNRQINANKEFEKASYEYIATSFDALKDFSNGYTRKTSLVIQKWEDEDIDNLSMAEEDLKRVTNTDTTLFQRLDNTKQILFDCRIFLSNGGDWHTLDSAKVEPLRNNYKKCRKDILDSVDNMIKND